MTVVGLDLSTFRIAAVRDGEPWVFSTKKGNADQRRVVLIEAAGWYFSTCPGAWVFCERPLALKNPLTTIELAIIAGAVWGAAREHVNVWSWVPVQEWKKVVVGKGNAKKTEVAEAAVRLGAEPGLVQDSYDAWCIWKMGAASVPSG